MAKKKEEPKSKKADSVPNSADVASVSPEPPKGEIVCRVIVEVLGAPKEHIEKAIGMLVDRMYEEKDISIVSEETFEAKEKGKLFSTFSEIEIKFKDLKVMEKFIFDYTPASIEIIEPYQITMRSMFLSGMMNDFILKMHETALKYKDASAGSKVLAQNTNAIIRNFIHYALVEPKSSEQLAVITGIPLANLNAILGNFEKAGIVKLEKNLWRLLKNG